METDRNIDQKIIFEKYDQLTPPSHREDESISHYGYNVVLWGLMQQFHLLTKQRKSESANQSTFLNIIFFNKLPFIR